MQKNGVDMKKNILLVLSVFLCLSVLLVGCKKADSAAPAATNSIKTVASGKLTVATSPDYAPYEFYAVDANKNPHLAGFDMALAQYIADYLGLELDVIPMDFDGILAEVQMGNVDLGISGFSPTPERAEVVDLSDIYYAGTQAFFCLESNAGKFKSLDDVNDASLTVGAQNGSIQAELATTYSADADIVYLTKVTDIVSEVLNGKLDGAYVETAVAESYAKNYPQLKVVLDVPFDAEGNVVITKKGNSEILAKVNEAIAQVIASGKMGEFIEQAGIDASGDIIEGMI